MSKLAKALTAAAGNAGESLYVEDVFSTYLYTGNSTARDITNGIDLSGEGGLVWGKVRANGDHYLRDTERGGSEFLSSNSTSASSTVDTYPVGNGTAFNSDGFSIGSGGAVNGNGFNFASWTFRKAEKFFDVVTYTGNGVAGRTVAHNLGSTPAVMIFKRTDASSGNWPVYVSALGATEVLRLNITNASFTSSDYFNDTTPTDSVFTVGNSSNINASGGTYVAYLFASDAGGFGDDGSENIIKCGSYTGTGAAGNEVNLGFEPQWLMFKRTDSTSDWSMFDVMRGIATGGDDARLRAQGSDAENTFNYVDVTATGFSLSYGGADMNASGGNYIYIAIRRPMKTPESGTEVFATAQRDTTAPIFEGGFPVDAAIIADVSGAWTNSPSMGSRLTGTGRLATSNTNAEASDPSFLWDYMNGWGDGSGSYPEYYSWMFKRATGFFDVAAYTGDGTGATTGRDINHNLGVVPDLMIIKKRNNTREWRVGGPSVNFSSGDYEYNGSLNSDITFDGGNVGTAIIGGIFYYYRIPTIGHTATTFRVGYTSDVNASGDTYIAYLFATLAGVSKVGSYTGTGSNVDVDCGFSAGARFVLIKRTDSTGDWYVWDSVRGIVAGNDPYLLLNSSAAEVTSTDYIDPLSSGFTVTSSAPAALNASGGTYIFLAIA